MCSRSGRFLASPLHVPPHSESCSSAHRMYRMLPLSSQLYTSSLNTTTVIVIGLIQAIFLVFLRCYIDSELAFSAHLVVKIHFPSCIKNLKMGWPELRAGCSSARQGRDNFTRIKLLAVNCESWVQWNQCGHHRPSILDTGSSQLHWRFSNDTVCPPLNLNLLAKGITASNFADFTRYICLHWSPNSTYHLYFVEDYHTFAHVPQCRNATV